jgi:hypothetical protein
MPKEKNRATNTENNTSNKEEAGKQANNPEFLFLVIKRDRKKKLQDDKKFLLRLLEKSKDRRRGSVQDTPYVMLTFTILSFVTYFTIAVAVVPLITVGAWAPGIFYLLLVGIMPTIDIWPPIGTISEIIKQNKIIKETKIDIERIEHEMVELKFEITELLSSTSDIENNVEQGIENSVEQRTINDGDNKSIEMPSETLSNGHTATIEIKDDKYVERA